MVNRSILFVCLGNICRSPTADGIARARAAALGLDMIIDSAGTGGWHAGSPPDPRSIAAAGRRGVDLSELRARKVTDRDFLSFGLILAMDRSNLADLAARRPPGAKARLALFLDEAEGRQADVPDPYYGSAADFDRVFELCDRGVATILGRIAGQAASG